MVSFFICGDILNYTNKSGNICSNSLTNIIRSADYSICNFEAPVSSFGKPIPKSGKNHYQRPETIEGLKKAGFNLLLLANNHIMDYGEPGLNTTIKNIKNNDVEFIGAGLNTDQAYKPLIKEISGIKIGIINCCEAQFGMIGYFTDNKSPGYAWINHSLIDKSIIKLKNYCDFVIVFPHAGLENYPIPQKEWRERYKYFCDIGADIIVGSHPHVPQGYEYYREKCLIFYSLGNFYFDSKNYLNNPNHSYALWLKLEKGKLPKFKPVFHYTINGQVNISPPEKQTNLKYLCNLLNDESYSNYHDNMSLETYDKVINKLLKSMGAISFDGSVYKTARHILSSIFKRKKKRDRLLLQLHLLRNESYYYAAKNALEIINRKSKHK